MKNKKTMWNNFTPFFSCARHGAGESPEHALIMGSVSQWQGCPPRGGIWRKPVVTLWSDEHEPQTKAMQEDKSAKQGKDTDSGRWIRDRNSGNSLIDFKTLKIAGTGGVKL